MELVTHGSASSLPTHDDARVDDPVLCPMLQLAMLCYDTACVVELAAPVQSR